MVALHSQEESQVRFWQVYHFFDRTALKLHVFPLEIK